MFGTTPALKDTKASLNYTSCTVKDAKFAIPTSIERKGT